MRLWLLAALAAAPALAADPKDEVQKVAEAYLRATTGEGEGSGKELLLGGATLNAQLFTLENWRIVEREPVRKETAELALARQLMGELDHAGRQALTKLVAASAASDVSMTEVSQEEAAKLLAPTREKAKAFLTRLPVMAYVARADREVYWHPKNPLRAVLQKAGTSGQYTLELHLFRIETKEGPRQVPRVWPLRVLRLRTAQLDTGWRILPASDWNAE